MIFLITRLLHRRKLRDVRFIPIMLLVCKGPQVYDVVAFGIVATTDLAIGQVTPPVSVNLLLRFRKTEKGMEVDCSKISHFTLCR